MQKIQKKKKLLQVELTRLQHYPCLPLIYEDHLLDNAVHQETADLVFSYLNLPSAPVATEYVKLGKEDLSSQIINYDEIISSLSNTPFASYLNKP